MKDKKLLRFVESFVLLPLITVSVPSGNLQSPSLNIVSTSYNVFLQKENTEAIGLLAYNQAIEQKAKLIEAQGQAIDDYFKARKMPLFGLGKKMAEEADKNDLDWRLLPAIAVRESTGGIHACQKVKHSFFGWGSCKIGFDSDEQAIEAVARNLGGNDQDTAHHYNGKNTIEILKKYNSVIPNYPVQVINIMNKIGDKEIILTPTDTSIQNGA